MNVKRLQKMALAAAALTVALGAAACGDRGDRGYGEPAATGTSGGEAGESRPVTLTGCLQRSDGNDFILTQADTSSGAVGTTGTQGSAQGVEQRQVAQASRAYRLGGDTERLDDLVGHRIRVSGTLEERADLADDARDRQELDEDDLARVEVSSVESVAPNCGTAGQR